MDRPNILLITMDQYRFDCMSYAGNPVLETPNLDSIAARGTFFTRCYSPSPSCIPARATLMTGLEPWHTGILGMGAGQGRMGLGFAHTLAGELAQGGYYCKAVGKMHFSPQRSLLGFHHIELDEEGRIEDEGFVSDYNAWFTDHCDGFYQSDSHGVSWNSMLARPWHAPEALHPTVWTVERSLAFLNARDRSLPFFLNVSFARPHSPYDPPQWLFDYFCRQELPAPVVGNWAASNSDPAWPDSPEQWRGRKSPELTRLARAGYYGSVAFVDNQLGRLLGHVRAYEPNTVILVTADHGDMLGDHHLWRKTYAFEGSAHVPLLLALPRGGQRRVCHAVVGLEDVMPTLLEAAGLPIPCLDGQSLLAMVRGEVDEVRGYYHGEHCACYHGENAMHYLTDGRIKYVFNTATGKELLFDLLQDPSELENLAGVSACAEELQSWRNRLIALLRDRGVPLGPGGTLPHGKDFAAIRSPFYQRRYENSPVKWQAGISFTVEV